MFKQITHAVILLVSTVFTQTCWKVHAIFPVFLPALVLCYSCLLSSLLSHSAPLPLTYTSGRYSASLVFSAHFWPKCETRASTQAMLQQPSLWKPHPLHSPSFTLPLLPSHPYPSFCIGPSPPLNGTSQLPTLLVASSSLHIDAFTSFFYAIVSITHGRDYSAVSIRHICSNWCHFLFQLLFLVRNIRPEFVLV